MKILVTGFTPFLGEQLNPSQEITKLLPSHVGNAEIVSGVLTTQFGTSQTELLNLIEKHDPDAILCLGQAGGRKGFTIEKVAINFADMIPMFDPERTIQHNTIQQDAETAFFATIPINKINQRLKEVELPASLSFSAGTFVCNYVFFNACYFAQKQAKKPRVGFVHVPFLPSQATKGEKVFPSLTIEEMVKGITEILQVIATEEPDNEIVVTQMRRH